MTAQNGNFTALGQRLNFLRRDRKLTLKSLSKKCGLRATTICDLENNKRRPSLETIELLCEVLHTHPNFLLGFSDQPEKNNYADEIVKVLKKLPAEDQVRALLQIKGIRKMRKLIENGEKPNLVRDIQSTTLFID